jgi:hypothetical protein
MRRAHRSVHRAIWPFLALVVGIALAMALVKRAPPPAGSQPAVETVR